MCDCLCLRSKGVGEVGGGAGRDDTAASASVHHTAAWDGHVQPKCE